MSDSLLARARAHRRVLAALVVLTVVGGALRAVEAASPNRAQSADELAYGRLAHGLAGTGSYVYADTRNAGRDPLHWSPGAVAVFAAVHAVAPAATPGVAYDVPRAYAVQAAAGTLAIPAAFALAALLAGAGAGLLAAGLFALYPPAIRSVADLLTEPIGTLALLLALLAVVLALRAQRRVVLALLGAGLLAGASVLVRGDLIGLPFALAVLVAVVLWRGERRLPGRAALVRGAVLAAGALLLLVPWSVNASLAEERLVPVTTGGASNLWIGTHLPGKGRLTGVKEDLEDEVKRRFPGQRATPVQELSSNLVLQLVAERRPGTEREAALRAEAFDNLREHALGDPLAFAAMMVGKADWMWLSSSRGAARERFPGEAIAHLLLVLAGALGLVAGLVLARGPVRAALAVPGLALLYVTAINAIFVPEARHNLPFMPVLFAAGVAGALLALRARRTRHGAVGGDGPRSAAAAARSASTT